LRGGDGLEFDQELTPAEDAAIVALAEVFARAIEATVPRVDVLAIDLELGHTVTSLRDVDGATNGRAPVGAVEALPRAPRGRSRSGWKAPGEAA
jgi:hypothetical protein